MARIVLEIEGLDEAHVACRSGDSRVDWEPDSRAARFAMALYQLSWGHEGALSNLPASIRKPLAEAVREVADLLDGPGDRQSTPPADVQDEGARDE